MHELPSHAARAANSIQVPLSTGATESSLPSHSRRRSRLNLIRRRPAAARRSSRSAFTFGRTRSGVAHAGIVPVSRDCRYQRGQRLVIYDAEGDFDRGFEWWERVGNGKDRLVRRQLRFESQPAVWSADKEREPMPSASDGEWPMPPATATNETFTKYCCNIRL